MGLFLGTFTPVPREHPPPWNNLTNLNQWPKREEKQKCGDGFQKRKNKPTSNCFLQYFFYSCSCFFFFLLLFYFFKTSKLESSVAPHTASFFRLAELYTLWNPAWMIQKKNINSNNENLLYVGGSFPQSFLLWSVGFLFLFLWFKKKKCLSVSLSLSLSHLFDIPLSDSSLCTFIHTQIKWQKDTWRSESCCL